MARLAPPRIKSTGSTHIIMCLTKFDYTLDTFVVNATWRLLEASVDVFPLPLITDIALR